MAERGAGRRRPHRPPSGPRFYASVLAEAERTALEAARQLEGLDEEIALLRVKLQSALAERPDDHDLLLKSVSLLVRAVATRYRIAGPAQEDLYQSIVGVLKGVGAALLPGAGPDAG